MKARLNIVLECYSINPILERKNRFIWLGHQNPPILEIGNSIEFLLINIQKIKLSLEDNILKPDKLQLPFPFPLRLPQLVIATQTLRRNIHSNPHWPFSKPQFRNGGSRRSSSENRGEG